jgi:hypothetical protein
MRKMLEHSFKAVVQDARGISGGSLCGPRRDAGLSRPCLHGTALDRRATIRRGAAAAAVASAPHRLGRSSRLRRCGMA